MHRSRSAASVEDWAHRGLTVGFLYSGIQLYILLSPYLCFISFFLDLYLLGDDTLIS